MVVVRNTHCGDHAFRSETHASSDVEVVEDPPRTNNPSTKKQRVSRASKHADEMNDGEKPSTGGRPRRAAKAVTSKATASDEDEPLPTPKQGRSRVPDKKAVKHSQGYVHMVCH